MFRSVAVSLSCRPCAGPFPANHASLSASPCRAAGPLLHAWRGSKAHHEGVTLIELLIVMVILAIIAAVGYPSYTQHILRAKRSAAQAFMMSVANKEEQYMLDKRQYTTSLTDLGLAAPAEVSSNYSVTVSVNNAASPPSYTISADPSGGQASDTQCAKLTLDQTGAKGIVGGTGTAAGCW